MSQGDGKKKNGKDVKATLDALKVEIGKMQRDVRDKGIPVVVVFEGWDIYGMAEKVNRFIRAIDPRSYDIYFVNGHKEDEDRPFIWNYFLKMPEKGSIAVFDRSWYFRLVDDYYDSEKRPEFESRMKDIRMLEEHHAREGCVFIKIFLDMGKKELRKRVEKEEKDATCRAEMPLDGDYGDDYKEVAPIWKDVLNTSSFTFAPWHVLDDNDEDDVMVKVFNHILDDTRPYLENRAVLPVCSMSDKKGKKFDLGGVNLDEKLDEKTYHHQLDDLQNRLKGMQCILRQKNKSVVIVFEGCDAAGKGGAIIRLTSELNPRCYKVAPYGAPTDIEKRHHYLWRFFKAFPRTGEITIFDRSWYGRVLVERVEKLATTDEWCRAYSEINDMERMLTDSNTIVMKFWLHIDEDTQLQRFKEREADPVKQWKINEEDWRNRSHWNDYITAVEDMIERTSNETAPWIVIPSNDKYYSRVAVLKAITERLEDELD